MSKFSDAHPVGNSPYWQSEGSFGEPILWDPSTQQPLNNQAGANLGPGHTPLKLVQKSPGDWDYVQAVPYDAGAVPQPAPDYTKATPAPTNPVDGGFVVPSLTYDQVYGLTSALEGLLKELQALLPKS